MHKELFNGIHYKIQGFLPTATYFLYVYGLSKQAQICLSRSKIKDQNLLILFLIWHNFQSYLVFSSY